MKKWIGFLIAVLCLNGEISGQMETSISMMDSLFAHITPASPGYMIGVIKDQDILIQKGYGAANLEYNIPIEAHSAFNIASLSKQFTAAAIALLILDDQLSLEDKVSDYLKDFPFAASNMQIKHLIYMCSGINDYYYNDRVNGSDWSSLHYFSIDTAIQASYSSEELMYRPGSQWSYSNINYMLLTKIVEQVSGMPFSTFVMEKIFRPIGMNNTLVHDDLFQVIPNRVYGYNPRDKENTDWLIDSGYLSAVDTGYLHIHRNSPHYGGSGIYSTMEDLLKWCANFESTSFGGQEFYQLMHQTMTFDHDKSNDAFGLVKGTFDNQETIWYEGGDWGFSAFLLRFPKYKTSVVCLSNLGNGNSRKYTIEIVDILLANGVLSFN